MLFYVLSYRKVLSIIMQNSLYGIRYYVMILKKGGQETKKQERNAIGKQSSGKMAFRKLGKAAVTSGKSLTTEEASPFADILKKDKKY